MSRMPAFQFYPSDWRKDLKLQTLTFEEKGVWFEMLCLMHESEQRGKLLLNGEPISEQDIAKLIGCDRKKFSKILNTLFAKGVAYKDDSGVIYNKRMVSDEQLIQIRRDAGSKGGNPNLIKQKVNHEVKQSLQNGLNNEVNQNQTPASASSSAYKLPASRDQVFEIMRRTTNPKEHSDDLLWNETDLFISKYGKKKIGDLASLVGGWLKNVEADIKPKNMVW